MQCHLCPTLIFFAILPLDVPLVPAAAAAATSPPLRQTTYTGKHALDALVFEGVTKRIRGDIHVRQEVAD